MSDKLEQIKDTIYDLEAVITDFEQSQKLLSLIMRKTDRTNPDADYCMLAYNDLQVYHNVLFDRLYDEVNRFNCMFEKLHNLIVSA